MRNRIYGHLEGLPVDEHAHRMIEILEKTDVVELIRGLHRFLVVAFRNGRLIVGIREIPDLAVVENTECFTGHIIEKSL